MTFPPTLFPYLAQTGAQSIAGLTALAISPDERAEHAAALRQILTEQNGYLSREQSSAYYPAELLEYALYYPEHAQAYTISVLILLQTATKAACAKIANMKQTAAALNAPCRQASISPWAITATAAPIRATGVLWTTS